MPPATTSLWSPARIDCAASMTALSPEPHTLLIVTAGMVAGSPPFTAARRAGACPAPACTTFPMMTSSTSAGSIPERSTAARTAMAPSCGAVSGLRPPRKRPMGVRAPPRRMTAVFEGSVMAPAVPVNRVSSSMSAPRFVRERFKISKNEGPVRYASRDGQERRAVGVGIQPSPGGVGIVLEHQEPALLERAGPEAPLRLQRDERLEVVPHDPGQRQVRGGRADVGEEARRLAVALHEHRLVVRRVAGRGDHAHALRHGGLAVHEAPQAGLRDRPVIVLEVARADALVAAPGEAQLLLLHHVARPRKRRPDASVGIPDGVAPGVVEVQVRVEDDVDVLRIVPRVADRVLEAGRLALVLDAVDLAELRVL